VPPSAPLGYSLYMSTADLEHPPEGVIVLAEPEAAGALLSPRSWVASVRRPTPQRLKRPVAEYLSEARDLGEA